jgi:sec-independent protein translocase protein TatA
MFGIQPIHIVIIIVVAFLIFGASRLPEIGRGLGKSISEFRKGTKEAAEGFVDEVKGAKPGQAAPAPAAPAPAAPVWVVPPAAATRPGEPTGNFCINCGSPNLPEARFCASCGSKMPEKVA